jgi:hypothetical protein
MDFAYRAAQAGVSIWRCDGAVAYHDDYAIADFSAYCRRMRGVSRMAALHFRRSPGALSAVPMFRDKTPIHWQADPPDLIVRKVARRLASTAPAVWIVEKMADVLEALFPSSGLLPACYRWVIGAHILQGYRAGVRELGTGKTA